MLKIVRYAALAAAGIGLAVAAGPSAEACGFVQAFGCAGPAFGMYRPVIRPAFGFAAFRPAFGFAAFRPRVFGFAAYRPTYGYAYAVRRHRVYRHIGYRTRTWRTYGWASPRHRFYGSYGSTAYGSAYGYMPVRRVHVFVRRPIFAWAPRIRPVYGAAFGWAPRIRPVYGAAFGRGC